jgi:hypothetical protein
MRAVVISLASRAPRVVGNAASARSPEDELACTADLCARVLTEARRQAAASRFGPLLAQLVARACDLLDEMDEVLVRLDPGREHEAFVRLAALHRDLEQIQSLMPRKDRSPTRDNGAR